MGLFKKKITIATHNGDFHADDCFACAALSIWAEKNNSKVEITRSRDKDIIKKANMVVDVGMEYDPDRNRFDHHQTEGSGKRENGIPYASFGLVWKKYGEDICGSKEVAGRVEKDLVTPIDARDNGINISKANEFGIIEHRTSQMISNFNLTVEESYKDSYKQFEKALYFAKEIIGREVAWAKAFIEGEKETLKTIYDQNEPEVLVLERNMEWGEVVSRFKKIKFVVYKGDDKEWCMQAGRDDLEDYGSDRANFPKSWQGLRDDELVGICEVKDAVFCIRGGWFAVAKSKEGALEMTGKALQIGQN